MVIRYKYNKSLVQFSQSNRKKQTDAERLLWRHLRNSLQGYKFRRQYPIHNFILDFYCVEKRLAIELDGGQHLQNKEYDSLRSKILSEQGINILRFWDRDVLVHLPEVLEKIHFELNDGR